ncbi:MAG TPA: pyruvate dehydrogenase (acetyl-transferring) E1 component subunit alpha [Tepidisphaeraceae bacterium]|nr:pyruvate dehydrogenase (acetyl-transferring) E1 component subunit alpha [Tepidisphaeraceae bacterium]
MSVAEPLETKPQSLKSVPVDVAVERERLRMMLLVRRFEERTFQEYTRPGQRIGGFCHLYSGQEAVCVGTAAVFQKGKDYLINGYRDHGHSLALGMEPRAAMAELFGRATGCSKGKGGSMHFFQPEVGNLGGHGIVGGQIPLGVGAGFSCWYKKMGGVSFIFFGDGAINQGTHNEAINLASLYKLPCIFVVENNMMAMGTQVERHSAQTDLAQRGSGYNMPHRNIDGNDLDAVIAAMTQATERARGGEGPTYLVANTYRYRGHSMSDAMKYRTKEELAHWRERDPITIYEKRLRAAGRIDDATIESLEHEVREIVEDSVKFADESPHPDHSELYTDVLAEQYPLQK